MTIIERAISYVRNDTCIGLGSGRAARAFVQALGEQLQRGTLSVRGVPTSKETASLAQKVGIPLIELDQTDVIDATFDGADEVNPHLDLIKGYGRALVREKIVAAASNRLFILVGEEKLVPCLGTRRKLPVEVVPFGLSFCQKQLLKLGFPSTPYQQKGQLVKTDNGNYIIDLEIGPVDDARELERMVHAIPGVVDTGLFLGMADLVLVGSNDSFTFLEEKRHPYRTRNWETL